MNSVKIKQRSYESYEFSRDFPPQLIGVMDPYEFDQFVQSVNLSVATHKRPKSLIIPPIGFVVGAILLMIGIQVQYPLPNYPVINPCQPPPILPQTYQQTPYIPQQSPQVYLPPAPIPQIYQQNYQQYPYTPQPSIYHQQPSSNQISAISIDINPPQQQQQQQQQQQTPGLSMEETNKTVETSTTTTTTTTTTTEPAPSSSSSTTAATAPTTTTTTTTATKVNGTGVNAIPQQHLPEPLTVIDALDATAQRLPNHTAIRVKRGGVWKNWTWMQYRQDIVTAAKSFLALGLTRKGSVNIIGFNSPEWQMSCVGAMYAGGVPTGVYTTSAPPQCEYFATHSDAQIVCVENDQQLNKYLQIREKIPNVKAFIVMEPPANATTAASNGKEPLKANGTSTTTTTEKKPEESTAAVVSENTGSSSHQYPEGVYTWEQFMKLGASISDEEIEKVSKSVLPSDLATLIYTSGTTSLPKGVMLTQKNIVWTCHTIGCDVLDPKTAHLERFISYLPLSHIAEQAVSLYAPLLFGFTVSFAGKDALQGSLLDTLKEVRPTIFFGVPRVWEKVQLKLSLVFEESGSFKKKLLKWAKGKGLKGGYSTQKGEKKPRGYGLARTFVFNTVVKNIGLDQARLLASAAAPISRDTLEFFLQVGITVAEAYGMSELTGPQTLGYPRAKTGSVGKSLKGSDIKIAEDGEICIRGPNVFIGYYKNEEATREAIDEEGWFHTGDIGKIDDSGYLYITDRKKELIITAGGENIAPTLLEGYLRQIPGINQAVVIGDRQKYLIALFTINLDLIKKLNYGHPPPATYEEAVTDKHLNEYLNSRVQEVNERLPNVQTIKNFRVLPKDFTDVGADSELTPTMKLKRKIILTKYESVIREVYGENYTEGGFTSAPLMTGPSISSMNNVSAGHSSTTTTIPVVATKSEQPQTTTTTTAETVKSEKKDDESDDDSSTSSSTSSTSSSSSSSKKSKPTTTTTTENETTTTVVVVPIEEPVKPVVEEKVEEKVEEPVKPVEEPVVVAVVEEPPKVEEPVKPVEQPEPVVVVPVVEEPPKVEEEPVKTVEQPEPVVVVPVVEEPPKVEEEPVKPVEEPIQVSVVVPVEPVEQPEPVKIEEPPKVEEPEPAQVEVVPVQIVEPEPVKIEEPPKVEEPVVVPVEVVPDTQVKQQEEEEPQPSSEPVVETIAAVVPIVENTNNDEKQPNNEEEKKSTTSSPVSTSEDDSDTSSSFSSSSDDDDTSTSSYTSSSDEDSSSSSGDHTSSSSSSKNNESKDTPIEAK
eukprot:gene7922-9748_t